MSKASTSDRVAHEAVGWGKIVLVGFLVVLMAPACLSAASDAVIDSAKESAKTPLGAAAAAGGGAYGAKKLSDKLKSGNQGGGGGGAAAGGGAGAGAARKTEPKVEESPPETTTTTTAAPRIRQAPLSSLAPPRRPELLPSPGLNPPEQQFPLQPMPQPGLLAR